MTITSTDFKEAMKEIKPYYAKESSFASRKRTVEKSVKRKKDPKVIAEMHRIIAEGRKIMEDLEREGIGEPCENYA